MSIEQTNVVDFISTDPTGAVVLTISDHLEWDEEGRHLLLLQEKLNNYLSFVKSGDLLETYPNAKDSKVLIRVAAQYPPNEEGCKFLRRAERLVGSAGFKLIVVTPELQ